MATGSKPEFPKRTWLPLFLLDNSGKIVTKLKFQKLTFLIQTEAKISNHYNFKKWYYGPYSHELDLDSKILNNHGLIDRDLVIGTEHPYWVFDIRENGHSYLETIQPSVDSRYINRTCKVLDRYKGMDHNDLVQIVYENYGLNKRYGYEKKRKETSHMLKTLLSYFDAIFNPEYKILYDVLAFSEYCLKAIEKIDKKDNLIKSVILNSTNELAYNFTEVATACNNELIESSKIRKIVYESSDPDFYEIFNFIENFCVKNGILPKINEIDFSDFISNGEIKNLEDSIRTAWNS